MKDFWEAHNLKMIDAEHILKNKTERVLYEKLCDMLFAFRHQSILDMGCGVGVVPFLLNKRRFDFSGRRYVCVDYSEVAIEAVKKLCINSIKIELDDMFNYNRNDNNKYDIILFSNVMNGMTDEQIVKLLSNGNRYLNEKTGIIIIVMANQKRKSFIRNYDAFSDIMKALGLEMYSINNYNIWTIVVVMRRKEKKYRVIPILSDNVEIGGKDEKK